MISLDNVDNIYIAPGPTDMRKSIDSCSAIVQYHMYLDPFSKDIFIFCNKKKDTIQILEWDGNGFWILFIECLLNCETIKVTADKVGICENTVLAWRHKTMYLIYKMLEKPDLQGEVELDETLFGYQFKGTHHEIDVKKLPGKEVFQTIK